jgi:hypothetical protein
MIREGIEADFPPRFPVKGRDVIKRQWITLRLFAAIYIEQQNRSPVAPRSRGFLYRRYAMNLEISISGKLHGFRREKPARLMMAVTAVNAAPAVNDYGRPEGTDDFDHILQNFFTPNFFRFLGSLGVAKIFCAREKKFDAVTARGGKQLLRANKTKLRSLLWAEIVLAAFAASEREKCDFGMESAREIRENGCGFVIGVCGDVENARSDSGIFDGLDGFRESGTGATKTSLKAAVGILRGTAKIGCAT